MPLALTAGAVLNHALTGWPSEREGVNGDYDKYSKSTRGRFLRTKYFDTVASIDFCETSEAKTGKFISLPHWASPPPPFYF